MDSLVNEAQESADDGVEFQELGKAQDDGAQVSDEELAQMLDDRTTDVTVVGCGGAGCNTVTRMVKEGITGADLVAVNTDAQHLARETNADKQLLIGGEVTGGQGAGALPGVGESAAEEDEESIRREVRGSDMVFVTAGMGGGTGTGAAPVVSRIADEEGALTIAVVSLPFEVEGKERHDKAKVGVRKLRETADTVIVVPNEKLLDAYPDLSLKKAFRVSDGVLMRSVQGITDLINNSGEVNLDFADVETVMNNGDVALIGLGEGEGSSKPQENSVRARKSVEDALSSPLLDVDISDSDSVLVNVTGEPDMTIEEAESVVEEIHETVGDDTRIIWGASVSEDMSDTIQTMVVVTGIDSPQIHGQRDMGIDHVGG